MMNSPQDSPPAPQQDCATSTCADVHSLPAVTLAALLRRPAGRCSMATTPGCRHFANWSVNEMSLQ